MRKKSISLITALILLFSMVLPANALSIPKRPVNKYVLDNAGVLTSDTENMIIERNKVLFNETGAEIAVVAVEFISGDDSYKYAYEIFSEWGLGSSQRNNGVLLVFATKQNKVFLLQGSGIDDYFSASDCEDFLQDNFYTMYDNAQYDDATEKLFNALYSAVYSKYIDLNDGYGKSTNYVSGGGQPAKESSSNFPWMIIIVALLFIILISSMGRGRGGGGGYGGGGGGGFWQGMFLGNMLGGGRRRRGFGGFGGYHGHGGFGGGHGVGFTGGGGSHGSGAGRGGSGGFGGFGGGGGFSGGGGSHGSGAGRR